MFVEANPETLQGEVGYGCGYGTTTPVAHPQGLNPVWARTNLAEITVLKTGLPWQPGLSAIQGTGGSEDTTGGGKSYLS
jgi:hypothetical protein